MFAIVCIEIDSEGSIKKGLLVHRSKNSTTELTGKYASLLAMLEGVQDMGLANKRELLLEATGNHATYYDIGNLTYTRKKVEAVVKQTQF